MSVRGDLPESLRFLGFEDVGACLRACFEVVDAQGAAFLAYVEVTAQGAVSDLQSNDGWAGTTGRVGVDELVLRRAQAELVRARAANVVAGFDRRRERARRRA